MDRSLHIFLNLLPFPESPKYFPIFPTSRLTFSLRGILGVIAPWLETKAFGWLAGLVQKGWKEIY